MHKDWYKPSDSHGPLVYFTSADVQQELDRVERAGGKIVNPKTLIKEDVGYMAVFTDTEGNRIALHSRK
ncbi:MULTISPECIES: VOC family protein [Zeaxanthinibacter]|uniref:VOC family protein n=1 Tax=Zeaxanthinibacter TaxID=561554 RepID=UPI00300E3A66